LLGVGWNFLFVGGTALLTETYAPSEKAKVQGWNDVVIFSVMLGSSLTSGVVVTGAGWAVLNALALPLVALTLVVLVALRRRVEHG
jgi:MFS family permease